MERYMTNRLLGMHEASLKSRFVDKLTGYVCGVAVMVLLPLIHLGMYNITWGPDKPAVNRDRCTCDCFDTIFRGRYEWPPSAYKHIYFNSTMETFYIWLIAIAGLLALYECIRYIVPLIIHSQIRYQMLALFVTSLYPHYYGWWGLFSYVNEGFYDQWRHQCFFSLTEVLSTAVVVHLCNKANCIQPWKLLVIFDINLMHIIIASLDQFVGNVLYRQGQHFEVARDLGLMLPDMFHVLLAYFEASAVAERKQKNVLRLFYREELLMSLVLLILFSLLGKNL